MHSDLETAEAGGEAENPEAGLCGVGKGAGWILNGWEMGSWLSKSFPVGWGREHRGRGWFWEPCLLLTLALP